MNTRTLDATPYENYKKRQNIEGMIFLKPNAQFITYEGQVNYIISSKEQAVGKLQITEESIKFNSFKATMR